MAIFDRELVKTIVSINVFVEDENKQKNTVCIGTGFLVNYPTFSGGTNEHYTFMVTNKHVVEGIDSFHYGLHKMDGQIIQMVVDIKKFKKKGRMKGHINDEIDIVAIVVDELGETNLNTDFLSFPLDSGGLNRNLLIKSNIYEGREVYTAGYPLGMVEDDNVFPIIRHGCISRISGHYRVDKPIKEYLIDVLSYPGSSGSPVFLAIDSAKQHKIQGEIKDNYLIGILNSYYPYMDKLVSQQSKKTVMIREENSGLTNVFMVDHIMETIELFDHIIKKIPRD